MRRKYGFLNSADIISRAIPANGVAVAINGSYALSGHTPDTQGFERIVKALNGTTASRVFATDRISQLVPEAIEHASLAARFCDLRDEARVERIAHVKCAAHGLAGMRGAGQFILLVGDVEQIVGRIGP